MKKRKSLLDAAAAAVATGANLSDRAAAFRDAAGELRRDVLPLAKIGERPHGDTRPLSAAHVVNLAESIAALGLLEPPVVDRKGRLVAGGHRLAAVRVLAVEGPEARAAVFLAVVEEADEAIVERVRALPAAVFDAGAVPVYSIADLDAATNAERALAIEAAENEKRTDYTRPEVEALAKRLEKAGYRFDLGRGRPKAGQRAALPVLGTILGKSQRTVRRILAGDDKSANADYSDPALVAARALRGAVARFRKAATGSRRPSIRALVRALEGLDDALGEAAD